jgi:hypothetical protein
MLAPCAGLGFRLIYRRSGQYNSDDIWGLFGDMFDQFGMPRHGFLLEGGHWRSDKVIGKATGLSDEERLGGLASSACASGMPKTPGASRCWKAISTWANSTGIDPLASAGANSAKTPTKRFKPNCGSARPRPPGAYPHCHPKEFFPHATERANFIAQTMANLNNTRNDGQSCAANCPLRNGPPRKAIAPRFQIPPSDVSQCQERHRTHQEWACASTVGSGKNLQPFCTITASCSPRSNTAPSS